MLSLSTHSFLADSEAGDALIPLIRAAATIGFAIAPCSLGFVIIAVSEQLIRSIMVGDDPEMLVSQLQRQFPLNALGIQETDESGLVARVVDLIEQSDRAIGSGAVERLTLRVPVAQFGNGAEECLGVDGLAQKAAV